MSAGPEDPPHALRSDADWDPSFRVTVTDRRPVPLPVDRFSVRKTSALWFQGHYYLYADVIPWDNPYHPDSYDSSIHLFRSVDAENWEYQGEVIGKGWHGAWTASGVATPGACVFRDKVLVAYSVRGNPDGSGHRFIGLSAADHPRGPFHELEAARIIPEDVDYARRDPALLLDDPCLVACNANGTGPGDERLYIYYRRSSNSFGDPDPRRRGQALEYDIRCRHLAAPEEGWSPPTPVLSAAAGKVIEAADARWIGDRMVMIVLGYSQGEMAVYVSRDSRQFIPARPHLLEEYLDIFMPAACFRLPGLIPDADGRVRHLSTPGDIDDQGHYTQFFFRVTCV